MKLDQLESENANGEVVTFRPGDRVVIIGPHRHAGRFGALTGTFWLVPGNVPEEQKFWSCMVRVDETPHLWGVPSKQLIHEGLRIGGVGISFKASEPDTKSG